MANRTSGWVIVGSIARVVAAVWLVLSPPGLWELYESGRLSGLVAALAWLLPLLAFAGAGWHWRDRWKRWLRQRYASAVYRAAWPVRDDLASALARSVGAVSDAGDRHEQMDPEVDLAGRIEKLSSAALVVLKLVLSAYEPSSHETWYWFANGVELLSLAFYSDEQRRKLKLACKELKERGILSQAEPRHRTWQSVRVELAPVVRQVGVLRALDMVEERLEAVR